MAYKKKIEFSVAAVAMTILAFPELKEVLGSNAHGHASGYHVDTLNLKNWIALDGANKWYTPALRTLLREAIENNPAMLENYLNNLEERSSNKSKEFSLEIKGSGTREKLTAELRGWLSVLENTTIEELVDGVEYEDPNSTLKTGEAWTE